MWDLRLWWEDEKETCLLLLAEIINPFFLFPSREPFHKHFSCACSRLRKIKDCNSKGVTKILYIYIIPKVILISNSQMMYSTRKKIIIARTCSFLIQCFTFILIKSKSLNTYNYVTVFNLTGSPIGTEVGSFFFLSISMRCVHMRWTFPSMDWIKPVAFSNVGWDSPYQVKIRGWTKNSTSLK